MYKQLLVPQRPRHGDIGNDDNVDTESETPITNNDDLAPKQSSETRGADYVVTLDVRGKRIRTNAYTFLLNHGCSEALADDIEKQRIHGPDVHPIFINCDPKDFMLMLNFFHYGPAYIDADTLSRIGRVMAYLGMTSTGRSVSSSTPSATRPEPRLCDAEYARARAEMQQNLAFILTVDYNMAQRAIERYTKLDARVYRRSADGTWHPTEDDLAHAHAERDRLVKFILDATVSETPVDEKTKMWAERRYRHLTTLLAEVLPPAETQTQQCSAARGGFTLTARQQTMLFVGALFFVPVIVSAILGSQRTTYYR
ncbi:BTB domain containing protein [Pandoravirus quercus]|uniref:BTB domain containing protein n=1 Tax=Pandoravirus quercus TaxID=2107709 RepID=A0A2U7U9J9_9VIRU|nr:BTB domain containing protein [Pandoravirus quercus]AVK75109.1 BTB domain containing protein [Pandoravirus quercus]